MYHESTFTSREQKSEQLDTTRSTLCLQKGYYIYRYVVLLTMFHISQDYIAKILILYEV